MSALTIAFMTTSEVWHLFYYHRLEQPVSYGGWMVRSIQELRPLGGGTSFKPYAVGEYWDSESTIDDWLDEANAWSGIRWCI